MERDSTYNIICFGFMPWSNMWKRNQSMMAQMARFDFINKVIFVNPDISLWHILNSKRMNGDADTAGTLCPQAINSKILRYTPVHVLPYKYRFGFLQNIENRVHLRKLRQLNNEKPYILFMNCPNRLYQYPLDELLKNSAFSIFDFSDDFVELVHNEKGKKAYLANINKYAQAADIVLTVNEHMKNKYGFLYKSIHVIRIAKNYDNFHRKSYRSVEFLDRIKRKKQPIIGYSGWIGGGRIDSDLLDALLEKRPNWQYVFIGPSKIDFIRSYSQYKNFHYLPAVDYQRLPDHIRYFDVAVVPFKINEHTRGNDLLKLHDYLAMGKPIVTTKIGGAQDLADVIRIAHTPEEFLNEIEKALIDTSQDLIQRRKEIAFMNSWPNRIKEVEELIKHHLDTDHANT